MVNPSCLWDSGYWRISDYWEDR